MAKVRSQPKVTRRRERRETRPARVGGTRSGPGSIRRARLPKVSARDLLTEWLYGRCFMWPSLLSGHQAWPQIQANPAKDILSIDAPLSDESRESRALRGWVAGPKEFASLIDLSKAAPLPQTPHWKACLGMLAPRLPVGLPPSYPPLSGDRSSLGGPPGGFPGGRVVNPSALCL